VGDATPPIDQHPDLSADLGRDARQLARELVGHELVRCQAAPVQTLELTNLAGLQAMGVTDDADGDFLDAGCAG
jgi:hypothetical protein